MSRRESGCLMRGWKALAIVLAVLGLAPQAARADTFALLIGVGAYEHFDKDDYLLAPRNDAEEMKAVLMSRGMKASNITLLIDAAARKKDIEDKLDSLMRQLHADDFLVVYFSGHGSYQPDEPGGDEEDGLDEVILPYDTEIAAPSERATAIRNAIVDDELGRYVDGFSAKGINTWWILDSCHSGTGLRGGGFSRTKSMSPDKLGVVIDRAKLIRAKRAAQNTRSGGTRGLSVFFYASQADERARERPFPISAPPSRGQSRSVFTHALAATLTKTPKLTYRAAIDAVNPLIRQWLPADRSAPPQTAGFDGDSELLDRPIIGSPDTAQPDVTQWPVSGTALSAGYLHGVEPGSIVALYDKSDAADDRAVGYAEVARATPSDAVIIPIAGYPCPLENGNRACRRAEVNSNVTYARLIAPALEFGIVVSAPRALPGASEALISRAKTVYETLRQRERTPLDGRVKFDDGSPEYIWWVEAGGFRIARINDHPAEVQFGAAIDIGQADAAADIERKSTLILLRAYRIQKVLQLTGIQAAPIDIEQKSLARPLAADGRHCGDTAVPLERSDLGPCTTTQVTITNTARDPRYINIFLLDEDWNIRERCSSAQTSGTGAILAPNKTRHLCELKYGVADSKADPSLAPFSRNSLMIVSSPFRGGSPPDFRAVANLNNERLSLTRAESFDLAVDDRMTSENGMRGERDTPRIKLIQWNIDRRKPN